MTPRILGTTLRHLRQTATTPHRPAEGDAADAVVAGAAALGVDGLGSPARHPRPEGAVGAAGVRAEEEGEAEDS